MAKRHRNYKNNLIMVILSNIRKYSKGNFGNALISYDCLHHNQKGEFDNDLIRPNIS